MDFDRVKVSFEGNRQTDDTPWHITAGMIGMDNEGECIFITPNTGVKIDDIAGREQILFEYKIHPWVSEVSDGAGLLIWIMDKEENILDEFSENVDTEDVWKELLIDLSGYNNVRSVKIFCNNGGNNDDSGDWVVLK